MKVNKLKQHDPNFPKILLQIPSPPKELYWAGAEPSSWLNRPRVAIVGSRKVTPYGRDITDRLAGELARAGAIIVSGLAYGADSIAHQAAIKAGSPTVAVLPTELSRIYPAAHTNLARQIVEQSGTLVSEYGPGSVPNRGNFIARNRLISGLAEVLLITEAAVNSGTLHTAAFALEQGRTVMAVPGNITSLSSEGCNNLIKSGALPVTDAGDVLFALNIKAAPARQQTFRGTDEEKAVMKLIVQGVHAQEELALKAKMDGAGIGRVLTTLEINGHIKPLGGGNWTAA